MKKAILFLVAILIYSTSFGQGQIFVHGYYRSNGTYVEGYHRTFPNNTKDDNWSTIGNVNPYTGKEGTKPGGENYSHGYSNTTYSSSDYNSIYSYSNPTSEDTYSNSKWLKRKKTFKFIAIGALDVFLIGFVIHSLSPALSHLNLTTNP